MKNIGIITFHKAHNYGAMLQVFALSKKLKENYNVEVIDYYNKRIYGTYKVIRPFNNKIIASIKTLILDIIFLKRKKRRYKSFNEFINKKCNLSVEYNSDEKLKNAKLNYDIIITGSDQIWSKDIVGEVSDIYTLNFVDDSIKKISYAASVGDASTVLKNKEEYYNKISKINYISVRENDLKEELSKIMANNIEVVLDPTLLLTCEEWNEEITNKKNDDNKYILAYVVKPDDEYIKIVNDLSEKTGLKIIHFGMKNPGYKNVLKSAYSEGPLEFVEYIKHAEYVIATSFHATAFSIIFNKKFFVVPHRKTGARVTNILDKLEITGRAFSSYEDFKNIDYDFETNWEVVNKKLNEERQKSINWLKNAIEG